MSLDDPEAMYAPIEQPSNIDSENINIDMQNPPKLGEKKMHVDFREPLQDNKFVDNVGKIS